MSAKYKRHFLKIKEAKSFIEEVSEKRGLDLNQLLKAEINLELVRTEFADVFFINGRPLLAKIGENVFPTLVFDEFFASASKIVVDMGAVPHVCNGADVMAPGVVRFEGEFRKGDLVLVVDEKHGKAIAVGEALYDADAAKKVQKGVVARNMHFVGDRLWNFIKKIVN